MAEFSATVIDESAVGAVCSCMRCKSERYDSISKLNHHRAQIIERCMDMLGDVPGRTLEERLTKLQGWYLEMQFLVGDLKHREQEDNAAFIVKAVNGYDATQDLLVDIWFHLSDTTDPTLRKIADRARALIPDPVGDRQ